MTDQQGYGITWHVYRGAPCDPDLSPRDCPGCHPPSDDQPAPWEIDPAQMAADGWTRMSYPANPRDPHGPTAHMWVGPEPAGLDDLDRLAKAIVDGWEPLDPPAMWMPRTGPAGAGPIPIVPVHPGDPGLFWVADETQQAVAASYFPQWFTGRKPLPAPFTLPTSRWRRWARTVRRFVLWCLPARRVKL